jgi:hypothetical protein
MNSRPLEFFQSLHMNFSCTYKCQFGNASISEKDMVALNETCYDRSTHLPYEVIFLFFVFKNNFKKYFKNTHNFSVH